MTAKNTLVITVALAVCLLTCPLHGQSSDAEQKLLDQGTLTKLQKDSIARLNTMLIQNYLKRVDALKTKLDSLSEQSVRVQKGTDVLMFSDRGRQLATRDEAVRAFMGITAKPAISKTELDIHLERLEPIRQGIASYAVLPKIFNAADVPECTRLADEEIWVDQSLREVNERKALITALLALVPKDTPVTGLPTLESRIEALRSTMVQEEVTAIDKAREDSRLLGIEKKAEAASTRELENAKIAAENELKLLRLEIEKARADFALIKAKREAAIQEVEQAAEQENLNTKLEDTAVLQKLQPFTALGYWQPGDASRSASLEKKPMSFSRLQSFGALMDGHNGIARLLAIANKNGCTVQSARTYGITGKVPRTWYFGPSGAQNVLHMDDQRPKWSYPRQYHDIDVEELREVQNIQQLLIELGPTMVEQGLLSP